MCYLSNRSVRESYIEKDSHRNPSAPRPLTLTETHKTLILNNRLLYGLVTQLFYVSNYNSLVPDIETTNQIITIFKA